jgi:hypothetical protein
MKLVKLTSINWINTDEVAEVRISVHPDYEEKMDTWSKNRTNAQDKTEAHLVFLFGEQPRILDYLYPTVILSNGQAHIITDKTLAETMILLHGRPLTTKEYAEIQDTIGELLGGKSF